MPSKTAMFTVKWYEQPLELEVKLEFVGTAPEFSGIVNVSGKIILTPEDPPSPSGFQLYEGRGTLTYRYTPIEGRVGCSSSAGERSSQRRSPT